MFRSVWNLNAALARITCSMSRALVVQMNGLGFVLWWATYSLIARSTDSQVQGLVQAMAVFLPSDANALFAEPGRSGADLRAGAMLAAGGPGTMG